MSATGASERGPAPELELERPIDADWLALREPADTRARDAAAGTLLPALLARWEPALAPRVLDLGSGTGANLRWLAPRLPRPEAQHWLLLDHDQHLLDRGADLDRGLSTTPVRADVTELPGVLAASGPVDLVTAAALLDLLTLEELGAVVSAVVAAGTPALFSLTVDGGVTLDPPDPGDSRLGTAFDAHQRRGGRLGPRAGEVGAGLFRARGWRVVEAPTPWELSSGDEPALVEAWSQGWAGAAVEHDPDLGADADGWLARRREQASTGLGVVVGHVDLLALPPE